MDALLEARVKSLARRLHKGFRVETSPYFSDRMSWKQVSSRMGTKHLSETMKISAPARRCNRSRTIILRVFTPLFRKKIIGIYHFQPGSLLCTSSDGCEASFCPSEQPASYFSMPRLRLVSDNFEQMELNIRAIVSTTISPDDYGLTGRVSSRSFPRYRRLLVELEHIGWL
jgi:hypothetical protein